jgi:hypothetical protein
MMKEGEVNVPVALVFNVVHFVVPKDLPLRLKTEGSVGLKWLHFANVIR